MTLADDTEGRIISIVLNIKISPPQTGKLGHTDRAIHIANGFIVRFKRIIKSIAEHHGFTVEVRDSFTVH